MDFDHEDRLAIKPDAGGPYFGGRKSWYNALAEGAHVSYELVSWPRWETVSRKPASRLAVTRGRGLGRPGIWS